MKKLLLALALLWPTALWAQGQGSVANHAVPIGRGPGVTGFGAAAPGTVGFALTSNGPGVDPTFQAFTVTPGSITNSLLATMAANTLKANITAGVASPTDVAIPTCNGTGQWLDYTPVTGFTCVTLTATLGALTVNGQLTVNGAIIDTSGNATLKTLILPGSTSGSVTVKAAAIAGANTITLPAGTTDFSATGGTNLFVAQTSVGAALTLAQPNFTNLAGQGTCAQEPALAGDVTSTAGSCTTTVGNLPTGTTAAGSILHSNIAAPATPAAGKDSIYTDSTDLRLHDKNASGVIGTTVVADTGAANNFVTAISAAGGISKAQPTFTNISGTLLSAQMPALSGDVTNTGFAVTIAASAVTYAKMQNVTASRLLGNPTGSAAAPSEISLAGSLAFAAGQLTTSALTGDVTAAVGGTATTIAANAVTNAKAAQGGANTVKGNFTAGTANEADNAVPSCSGANQALSYTSGTGLGCVTISAATTKGAFYGGSQSIALGSATTQFSGIAGQFVSSEASAGSIVPIAGTIKNLFVSLTSDPGNTNTVALTMRKSTGGGAFTSQTVTCTITGNGTTSKTCSDTTHSFTVAAGDLIDLQNVDSTITGGPIMTWAAEYDNP